ncbi:hydrolase [Actinoallomurus purpureus]|uniref:acyl-CoA dehydrogenase family protein n=1 Tax=Actinoallomurus purpureus TaxID=478114 RepID=UPI002093C10F|nr:acyl-CoA dehydrogenase family protein [Actinoallomurus purpureus]MCO6011012.1 hydrolase [Actinoallomurus purpureus]
MLVEGLTGHGPSPAVTEAKDVAAAHAETAESERRLPGAVVDAIIKAGFPAHFVPRAWGGREGTFTDFTDTVSLVGEGCASAAWCAALYATLGRMMAHLPLEGQREVWANGPNTLIVGAISPGGRVEKADGGWRLTGHWPFTSGADHSDWALIAAMAPEGDRRALRYFAVPRHRYQVIDTWFNVGMRGTGSNTLVLEDVLVPAHLCFAGEDLWAGKGSPSTARCHNIKFRSVNGLSFVAPALGAAQGALQTWSAWIAEKIDTTGRPTREQMSVRVALAHAAGEIDAARLLLERAAAGADADGVPEDADFQAARNSRDYSIAIDLLASAVDRLFRAGGARGQAESGNLQRAWRDVNCAAGHVALRFEANATDYFNVVVGGGASLRPDYRQSIGDTRAAAARP